MPGWHITSTEMHWEKAAYNISPTDHKTSYLSFVSPGNFKEFHKDLQLGSMGLL